MGGFVNSKDGHCSGLATKSSSRGKMRQVLPSDVVLTNIHSKSICVCSRDEGSCIFFLGTCNLVHFHHFGHDGNNHGKSGRSRE